MKSKIKNVLREYLFKDEIRQINLMLSTLERETEADKFFIDQGMKVCRWQLNNPRTSDPRTTKMDRTLMGHGITTAAEYLGIRSKQWDRARKHITKTEQNAFNKKHGLGYFAYLSNRYEKVGER